MKPFIKDRKVYAKYSFEKSLVCEGIDIVTVSAIRLKPGNTIPLHRDTFYKIKTQFPDDERPRVRANINLENWKTGHIIQYDDKVITGWKQGDGHLWDSGIEHLGANCGMESKFSLQVSGFLI